MLVIISTPIVPPSRRNCSRPYCQASSLHTNSIHVYTNPIHVHTNSVNGTGVCPAVRFRTVMYIQSLYMYTCTHTVHACTYKPHTCTYKLRIWDRGLPCRSLPYCQASSLHTKSTHVHMCIQSPYMYIHTCTYNIHTCTYNIHTCTYKRRKWDRGLPCRSLPYCQASSIHTNSIRVHMCMQSPYMYIHTCTYIHVHTQSIHVHTNPIHVHANSVNGTGVCPAVRFRTVRQPPYMYIQCLYMYTCAYKVHTCTYIHVHTLSIHVHTNSIHAHTNSVNGTGVCPAVRFRTVMHPPYIQTPYMYI